LSSFAHFDGTRDAGRGTKEKGEGEAPAEPKLSASREVGKSADWERFGLTYRFALPATE